MATAFIHHQGVVVWEWCNEHMRWRPYESHVSNHIEGHYLQNHNMIVTFQGIDQNMTSYQLNLGTKEQVRLSTGTTRTIHRAIYPLNSLLGQGISWQWSGDINGQWHNYDNEVGEILEQAIKTNQHSVDLLTTPSLLPYVIDLRKMTQTRHGTGFLRNVQRITAPLAYGKTIEPPTVPPLPMNITSNFGTPGSTTLFGIPSINAGHGPTSALSTASASGFSVSSIFGFPSHTSLPPPAHHGMPGPSSAPTLIYPTNPITVPAVPTSLGALSSKSGTFQDNRLSGSLSNVVKSNGAGSGIKNVFGKLFSRGSPTNGSVYSPGPSSSKSGRPKKKGRKKSPQPTEDEVLSSVCVIDLYLSTVQEPNDDDCAICCEKMNEPSGYAHGVSSENALDGSVVYQLKKCKHVFHKMCIVAMYNSGTKDGCIQCPTCKTIHGVKHGNCPAGRMDYNMINHSLAGYPDCNTISVTYSIQQGVQDDGHPNPGKSYNTRGFPRTGYLPNNEEGRKVLDLLKKAWKRRLTFTIGTSVTTGESDCVVWNEIHHKTELASNHSGHGYPDPKYLDNVTAELEAQGVTDADDESDML